MIKEPITFLFTGRSGCGKGTQIKLLREYLENNDTRPVVYIYAGKKLRELAERRENFTAELAQKIITLGRKQPDFLAVWAWAREMIDEMKEGAHLIFDGSPRSAIEAEIMDEMLAFYGREKIYPVFLEVSEEWASLRLAERGRSDDTKEGIKNRMEFFKKDVLPAIEYYETKSANKSVRINGEQAIAGVHKEIVEKIFNDND